MEYVEHDNTKLLLESQEYFLNTFRSLEETCIILAKNKIEINDGNAHNIIFNKNGATLIDVDSYRVNKLKSFASILLHNKLEIQKMFLEKVKSEFMESKQEIPYWKLNYLLNFDLRKTELVSSIYELCDKNTLQDSLVSKM